MSSKEDEWCINEKTSDRAQCLVIAAAWKLLHDDWMRGQIAKNCTQRFSHKNTRKIRISINVKFKSYKLLEY